MVKQLEYEGSKGRVVRHRARAAAKSWRRVEVTVPADDAGLIKALAGVLRAGGDEATRVREAFASMMAIIPARTGAELLAVLRASLLAGEDLMIERDQTTGRAVDIDY